MFVAHPEAIWPRHNEISPDKSASVELSRMLGSVRCNSDSPRCPEVWFGEVSSQSDVFQSQIVIHCMS